MPALIDALLENVPAVIFLKDLTALDEVDGEPCGRYVLVNRLGEQLMGRPRAEILGRTDRELFPGDQAARFRLYDRAALESAPRRVLEDALVQDGTGCDRRVVTLKLPLPDEATGSPRYVLGIGENVTEQMQDLATLREQNRRFDAAIMGMSHGLCMVDANERMIVCNAPYLKMFDLDPAVIRPGVPFLEILRHSVEVGVASQTIEELYAVRKQVIADGRSATYHEELSDGRLIAISHRPMPMPTDGSPTPHGHAGWVSIYEDVTAQRLAEIALQQQNRRFDAALSNMGQGLCMFDADDRVVVYNQRLLDLFGLPPDSVRVGQTYRELIEAVAGRGVYAQSVRVDALCEATRAQVDAMAGGAPQQPPLLRALSEGRVLAVLNRPMVEGGWVTTFEDVTELRQSEARIAHMARHDALTNLPNRTTFQERLEHAVAMAGRGTVAAIFYIDLDRFKTVNDTFGHVAGDTFLQIVADRLRSCVRDTDVVARLGGDEFAILQIGLNRPADAAILANRLLRAIAEPLHLDGQRIRPTMSIGVAVAPQDGTLADKLTRSADVALYRAKADGGHTYRFFEPEMEARLHARRQLEADLREAVESNGFELFYQPFVDACGDVVTGFEALVRWNHPERGLLPPAEFVSAAEETGLILPLGDWILRRACEDAATWAEPLPVAVNISPAQFKDPSLVGKIAASLANTGLPPSRLEIEITESVLLRDDEPTLAALHDLRAMGIRIAMDDFGTGHSSLSYLRSFPFDTIKIDRSFVSELGVKPGAEAIVRAIIVLATSLGMEVTAEGVETAAQLETLRRQGCTRHQGYLFSPPRPAGEVAGMIADRGAARMLRAVA